MRRIAAIVLTLVLMMSFAACAPSQAENKPDPKELLANVPAVQDLTATDTTTIIGVEDGVLTDIAE